MSGTDPAPVQPQVAAAAMTDDGIAPDLPTLMERLERARKFLIAEREYIKLILMGLAFVVGGTMFSYPWIWRIYLPIALVVTPFLYGWLSLPGVRLSNAFRNEVMPFLLRDYGRWNYAHEGPHFSREAFFKVGFLDRTDGVSVTSIITGERYGVPLQFGILSAWRHPMFGIYRGSKPTFAGWCANIHLAGLPDDHLLVLPANQSPADRGQRDWVAGSLTPTHQLWAPAGAAVKLPETLLKRLLPCMMAAPDSRYALSGGVLWVLVPGDGERFNVADDLNLPLNEPAPYHKARTQLAEVFGVLDEIVWPNKD